MEKYFKNIENNYIVSISTGTGAEQITQEEYDSILSVIHNRPIPEVGYDYILCADLNWELIELPSEPEDYEISDAEALDIILGGEV